MLRVLETRYAVMPIATTDARSLKQARLLLMAHPLAQPAENLVDLDQWVRDGGRVLLLADPNSNGRAADRWATSCAPHRALPIRACSNIGVCASTLLTGRGRGY